jgi:hypothetical protein
MKFFLLPGEASMSFSGPKSAAVRARMRSSNVTQQWSGIMPSSSVMLLCRLEGLIDSSDRYSMRQDQIAHEVAELRLKLEAGEAAAAALRAELAAVRGEGGADAAAVAEKLAAELRAAQAGADLLVRSYRIPACCMHRPCRMGL